MSRLARIGVAPWAASGAVVGCLALGSIGAAPDSDGRAYVTASGAPSAASAMVQTRADEVFEAFNGSQRQRDAAGVLQAWALNGGMDRCMEERGFPAWAWSATRNVSPRTDALGTSAFFSRPVAHSYSNAVRDMGDSLRSEQTARMAVPAADESRAIDACLELVPGVSDEAADDEATPAVARMLREEWWHLLADLDQRYGDKRRYDECFNAAATAALPEATADTWRVQLTFAVPSPGSIPPVGRSSTVDGAWAAFIRAEAALEARDWSCRRDVYEDHLDEVATAVERFAATNASEIAAARSAWTAVESRAAALGFRGQAGSIG